LEQRDIGNYKTDLHQIFRDGRNVGVGVDVQSGIGVHQIHMEDVFGPSLGRVGMSRSKVKGQGQQGGTKTPCALTTPPPTTEWNALAANNVTHSLTLPRDDFAGLRALAWSTSGLCHTFLVLYICYDNYG